MKGTLWGGTSVNLPQYTKIKARLWGGMALPYVPPPQIVDGIVLGRLAPVIGAVIGIVSVVPIDSIVSSSAGRSMTITTSGRSATVTTSDRSMIKEIN